jgi:hypothetical protein
MLKNQMPIWNFYVKDEITKKLIFALRMAYECFFFLIIYFYIRVQFVTYEWNTAL